MRDNKCLFCGELIPEGRQICPTCETRGNDKEKQIEEMARVLCRNQCTSCTGATCLALLNCKALYEHGYRKINENEIVISKEEKQKLLKEMYEQGKFDAIADLEKEEKVVIGKEEYEKLCHLAYFGYDDAYEKGCKETAEKIYTFVNSFGTNNWERFKGFIKQFGVEIGE